MKYKQQSKVLHLSEQTIKGDEPFLWHTRPRMIVNLSAGMVGSHNFVEGYVDDFNFEKGDVLAFSVHRIRQVPVEQKWYERVWEWVKR